MSKAKHAQSIDFEAKAAEVRTKRVETCVGEVNAVLEKHRCQFTLLVQVGNEAKPLSEVLGLPVLFHVTSK